MTAKTLTGAFVVVVEDELEQREALGSLLRRWGCHAVIARSAHGAIEQLAGHLRAPNAIISDYQLGAGATGPDAIQAICRALGEDVPSMILTGEHNAFRDSTIRTSGWPVVTKPVAPEHLRRQLANLLVRPG